MVPTSVPQLVGKLRIAEIFSSVQGEGAWVGTPSTFVRLSGCNLRCRWCDTPYASWNPEGPVLELDAVLEQIDAHEQKHVVLTGGEPLLFEAVVPLAQELHRRGHVITVETAGTVYRDLPCDLMSISPKLSGSTPDEASGWRERHDQTRIDIDVLNRLIARYPHQLKFVVNPEGPDDLPEILDLLSRLELRETTVMLMAEGRDAETLHRRERLLVPICMKHGFRLTPRYQIDLFGDTRGT